MVLPLVLLKEEVMTFVLALALQAALVGNYTCEGVNRDGKYAVSLQVTQEGDNYFLFWRDSTESYKGLGVRQGDNLAVVFVTEAGGIGVIHYEVKGGVLNGVWAAGDGVKYTEVCTPAGARAA